MGIALSLHVLSVVIWVGGMFFAWVILRPEAAARLEPPARLSLWAGVFARFFPWVFAAIAVILGTGFWMIVFVLGGFAAVGAYVYLMLVLGTGMMLIFFHVYFAPFRRLKQAVVLLDWSTAAGQLAQIRVLVGINLALGLLTVTVAAGGRFLAG